MFAAMKIKLVIVSAITVLVPMAMSAWKMAEAAPRQAAVEAPVMVVVAPGAVDYILPGEFTHRDQPVAAPRIAVKFKKPVIIMRHQVTAAEYQRCVDAHACTGIVAASVRSDMPAVMVSWRDATAYAEWLSGKLGVKYRLPTDEEWTYAAGGRAPGGTDLEFDADNPAKNWLSRYEREASLDPADKKPMPIGHFGANEHGLLDVSGNIWEWTTTCYARTTLDDSGASAKAQTVNCGVRVVEGRHRTYISDFIRDARGGGCAVGTPPSNLGFRLVRDSPQSWWLF